jgi:hypothetical protein
VYDGSESVCYQNLLPFWWFLCCCLMSCNPSGSVPHGRNRWHSRHPDFTPVARHTPSQMRNVQLFHFLTIADSAAFCMKTTATHHDRFSSQCGVETPTCCARSSEVLLEFLLITASLAAPTNSSLRTHEQRLCALARSSHTLPVSIVSLDGAARRENSPRY